MSSSGFCLLLFRVYALEASSSHLSKTEQLLPISPGEIVESLHQCGFGHESASRWTMQKKSRNQQKQLPTSLLMQNSRADGFLHRQLQCVPERSFQPMRNALHDGCSSGECGPQIDCVQEHERSSNLGSNNGMLSVLPIPATSHSRRNFDSPLHCGTHLCPVFVVPPVTEIAQPNLRCRCCRCLPHPRWVVGSQCRGAAAARPRHQIQPTLRICCWHMHDLS